MLKRINIIIVTMILFVGCGKSNLSKTDYIKYVQEENSKLIRKVDLELIQFEISYRPHDYIILQENDTLSQAGLLLRKSELAGSINLLIKIKSKQSSIPPLKLGIESLEAYNDRYNYFLNEASKDLHIEYGGAILSPSYYSFETSYGLTPEDRIIVQFILPNQENEPSQNIVLKLYDRIYNNGMIKATFLAKDLNQIPNLKL